MNEQDAYKPVATAVRVEHEENTDTVYLVFKIIDDKFKAKIKKDWTQDIDLKLINKKLYEFEED